MKTVIPNQKPQETIEERLRRLTREAIGGGQQNQHGPDPAAQHFTPPQLMKAPGGVPGGPDAVLHRIAREASGPSIKRY
jgi:hypothetical protein